MARRRFTTEQIIGYLRQAEVMIGRGCTIEEMLREIDVTANTYYRRQPTEEQFLFSGKKSIFLKIGISIQNGPYDTVVAKE